MTFDLSAVVFDDTALLALGSGNRMASHFVTSSQLDGGRVVFAPALCLAAAETLREGIAEHVGSLPEVRIAELDYAAAIAVGGLVRAGSDRHGAHAVHCALPGPEWPHGRPVVTTSPSLYAKTKVPVVRLPGCPADGRARRRGD